MKLDTTLGTPLGTPLMVPVPGATLAVWSRGVGPAVVLLHGGTGTAAHDWGHVLPTLARHANVVAMDLRGHGMSADPGLDLGVTRFGLDVTHVMRSLGIPRAILVGFSVGGNTVLNLITSRPWLASAAIIVGASARGRPERVMEIMNGPWPRELRGLHHSGAEGDTEHWTRLRDRLAQDWADNVRFIDTGLDAVGCPVTVVHGADDPIVDPEQARRLVSLLPDARLVEVPATGHQVHREAPEVFIDLVREVLAGD